MAICPQDNHLQRYAGCLDQGANQVWGWIAGWASGRWTKSGQMPRSGRALAMPEQWISRPADNDRLEIASYAIAEFGIAPGLRRIRQQAHVVFYLPGDEAILIVRVLHHAMDFERHF